MLRTLLTRRWIALQLVTVVVAVTCVRLGLWQLERLEQRRAHNALVEGRMGLPAGLVEELIPLGAAVDPDDVTYRRAEALGTFDGEREVVLFGRSLEGRPGHHLLTPLVTSDGRGLIVDRGWVPVDLDRPPVAEAAPPLGQVRVSGVLFPPARGGASDDGPVSALSVANLARLQRQIPYELYPVYLWAQEQEPGQASLPVTAPLPPLSEGRHLSYAWQWFLFAALALVVDGALSRRELRGARRSSKEV